jgi:hypothetical protein
MYHRAAGLNLFETNVGIPSADLPADTAVRKVYTNENRAVQSEPEGILGGVGVGKKCTDSDSDPSLKS